MSKVLWKSLLVSPAVLGATLLVSAGAMATETAASSKAIAPQTTEAQITGSQPVAIAPSSVAPAAEATNSVQEQQAPTTASVETSAKVDVTSSTQTVADLEAGSKVGVTASQEAIASPEALPAAESSKLWSVAPAAPKVAQTAPATVPSASGSDDSNVLQQINRYTREGNSNSIDQVTNVSQFSDVRPTDWAYQALRDLVERYGCIAGYPDSTFRGNRAMTRYEFAAGLNACLRQIEKLIAGQGSEVTRADLDKLNQLINQFRAELTTLGTRVDRLEGRVAFLEGRQFSTTTKLVGEAILAVTDEFGEGNNTNTIFGDRVRLDLQTSFTGQDKLHTRLAAGNLSAFNFATSSGASSTLNNTFEGQQTFNITNNNNNIILDWLAYEFPFGSSKVYLAATGGLHADYAPTLNPYFDNGDGGNGALSTFAQYSPIYRVGGGAGAGIRLGVGRAPILGPTSLTVGYLAGNAGDPGRDFGLFNGNYSALAQLNFTVSDRIGLAATYVHGYHNRGDGIFDIGGSKNTLSGVVGTVAGNNPFNATVLGTALNTAKNRPMVTNSYGIEAALRLSDRFSLSGFAGKTDVRVIGEADGDVWYYGLGLALPDLGKKGNLLGLFAGVEPYLAGLEIDGQQRGIKRDRSYHLEGFYKYQLTENISITPGIIWLTAPNQNDNNNDAVIGTLRTTFTF